MSDSTITRGADPAYRDALIAKLGGADPIHELSALFDRLPATLVGLSEAQLREPEAAGKWSVLEVIQHLADVELVQGMRIRRILVEDRPTLAPMDPDRWVRRLWSSSAPLWAALDPLKALRVANLHLVRGLDDAALDREAHHPERGSESLRTLLMLVAAHDGVHLEQILRIRSAIGEGLETDTESVTQ